jgi:hypothetical protein
MTTLRQAQTDGSLDRFIAEHEADPPGVEARFNATLQAMAGTSKAVQEASDEAASDD